MGSAQDLFKAGFSQAYQALPEPHKLRGFLEDKHSMGSQRRL